MERETMKLPNKIKNIILEEANKNARFNWYKGWKNLSSQTFNICLTI